MADQAGEAPAQVHSLPGPAPLVSRDLGPLHEQIETYFKSNSNIGWSHYARWQAIRKGRVVRQDSTFASHTINS